MKGASAPTAQATTDCRSFDHGGFKTFGEPSLTRALDEATIFAAEMGDNEGRWFTVTGNNGTGKTHLARAIWRHMKQHHYIYRCPITGANLARTATMRSWRTLLSETYDGAWGQLEDLRDNWFVVIDDLLGASDPRALGNSITDRLAERDGRWTVLTSNLSIEAIAEKDRRLASRMVRGRNVAIQIGTVDYSLRKS